MERNVNMKAIVKIGSHCVVRGMDINEYAQYNRVFVDVNKISTVFGRDNFEEYINNQIKKGNLVRIKNRSIKSSERNALIAKGYRDNAPTNSISQDSKNTTKNSIGEDVVLSRNDVYGTDIMLDIPTRTDIAPVQDKVDPFEDIPIRADVQQSDEKKYEPKQTGFPQKTVKTVKERNDVQREALVE